MIVGIDTETRGLSGGLITSCLYKSPESYSFHRSKDSIWKALTTLAQKEAARGKVLYVYAYNMSFDFYKIAKWDLKGIKIKNNKVPFIAEYEFPWYQSKRTKGGGKPHPYAKICFLDAWNLMRKSLAETAVLLNSEKLEMPNQLLSLKKLTKKDLEKIERYCLQDTALVLSLLNRVKKELRRTGHNVKNIVSIGQLAVNVFLSWCKANGYTDIFKDKFTNEIVHPKHQKEIHYAYRYGRIEAKREEHKGCYEVDINNLYSYAAINMPLPNLKSERIIRKPYEQLSPKGLANLIKQYPIGVSKVFMKTPDSYNGKCHGVLVTRIKGQRYFPNKKNKYISGSYTHLEILSALAHGYKLLDIEYTITFKEAKKNPFKEYFEYIYKLRKTGDKFSDHFWKMMANYLIGKFAQIRPKKEFIMDDIMKVESYYQRGFEFVKSYQTNYLYMKKGKQQISKHYNSIISAQVNAWAKIHHHKYLSKVPYSDFVYCDTDNIIFKGQKHLRKFPISDSIGDFKVSKSNVKYKSYNKKTYMIGDDIRASGATKPKSEPERKARIKAFEEGIISYDRMIGVAGTHDLSVAGTFELI